MRSLPVLLAACLLGTGCGRGDGPAASTVGLDDVPAGVAPGRGARPAAAAAAGVPAPAPSAGERPQPGRLFVPFSLDDDLGGATAVVLVIGTGRSMEKEDRLGQARDAAARFLGELKPRTEAGLVLFHHEPYRTVGLTTDRAPLLDAVGKAAPEGGNDYLDATAAAIDMLAGVNSGGRLGVPVGEPKRGAVVLITDARYSELAQDRLDPVIRLAADHGVTVYAVGFADQRPEPVRSVLVLDRSNSMRQGVALGGVRVSNLDRLRSAAHAYVKNMSEGSEATVVAFAGDVLKPEPLGGRFSGDRGRIDAAIDAATASTQLWTKTWEGAKEALELLARERGAGRPLQEHLVLFSDGEPTRQSVTMKDVIALARGSDVPVHTLLFGKMANPRRKGPENPRQAARQALGGGARTMKPVADETGGTFTVVTDPEGIELAFQKLAVGLHDTTGDQKALMRLGRETGGGYYPAYDRDGLLGHAGGLAARLNRDVGPGPRPE